MKKQGRKGKYGYIEFIDKRKLKHDGWDDDIEPEIRKPTPAEREEIILNTIRANSGKAIKVTKLANALAVSDRTIQTVLKKFEKQNLISRTPNFTDTGRQKGNILTYIGPNLPITGKELTLARLYNPDNPCGFRDWHWEEFKFIPGYFDEDFPKDIAIFQSKELKRRKKAIKEKHDKFHGKK